MTDLRVCASAVYSFYTFGDRILLRPWCLVCAIVGQPSKTAAFECSEASSTGPQSDDWLTQVFAIVIALAGASNYFDQSLAGAIPILRTQEQRKLLAAWLFLQHR